METPAQAIKKELKTLYPLTSFSVRYKTYSMGSSVDIERENGPSTKTIDSIVAKYEYGKFDGMTDSYDYTNVRKDIPQAKYIHTTRKITGIDSILDKYTESMVSDILEPREKEREKKTIVWRITQNCDITNLVKSIDFDYSKQMPYFIY